MRPGTVYSNPVMSVLLMFFSGEVSAILHRLWMFFSGTDELTLLG